MSSAWLRPQLPLKARLAHSCSHLKNHIHTLYRPSLSAADFLNFSNARSPPVPCKGTSRPARVVYWSNQRFPPNCSGFLYYDAVDAEHPASGQIRFRVTGSPDPASFGRGHDLLRPNGRPWAIPLPNVSCRKGYQALAALLVSSKLIPQSTMDALAAMKSVLMAATPAVSRGNLRFVMDFKAGTHLHMRVAQGTYLHTIRLSSPMTDQRGGKNVEPYAGMALHASPLFY